MSNIRTTDPFSAKEIIGDNIQQLLDPSSDMRKSFFWRPDPKDKRKVESLSSGMSLSMQTSSFLLLVSTPTETLMGRGGTTD